MAEGNTQINNSNLVMNGSLVASGKALVLHETTNQRFFIIFDRYGGLYMITRWAEIVPIKSATTMEISLTGNTSLAGNVIIKNTATSYNQIMIISLVNHVGQIEYDVTV